MTVLKPVLSSQTPMVRLNSSFYYHIQKDLRYKTDTRTQVFGGGVRFASEVETLTSTRCAKKINQV